MNTPEVTLNPCKIAKRGKGAKGFIEVETFGIPVIPEGSEAANDWNYSFVDNLTLSQVVDVIEQRSGLSQRQMKEGMIRGIDAMKKSENMQQDAMHDSISKFIIEQDLAETEQDASDLASVWQQQQAFSKKCSMPIPSIENLAEFRRNGYVAEKKAKGIWKATLVIPVPTIPEVK